MGKLGEEVSQKIKSAIKAKLIELGVDIENELPDYVMMLVANKKSQKQMALDLELFLGSSTVIFTTWLQNVLRKLEQVTVSSKGHKKVEESRSKKSLNSTSDVEIKESSKKSRNDSNNLMEIDEEDKQCQSYPIKGTGTVSVKRELLSEDEEMNESSSNARSEVPSSYVERKPGMSILKANENLTNFPEDKQEKDYTIKSSRKQREINYSGRDSFAKDTLKVLNKDFNTTSQEDRNDKQFQKTKDVNAIETRDNRIITDARDIIRKKISTKHTSEGSNKNNEPSGERDKRVKQLASVSKVIVHEAEKPVDVSIPSLVKVTPRPKRTGIQPNCNLILKAVADAEKSVATAKTNKKLKEVLKKNRSPREEFSDYIPPAKIAITLPNDRVPSTTESGKVNLIGEGPDKNALLPETLFRNTTHFEEDVLEATDIENYQLEQWSAGMEPKFIVTLDSGLHFISNNEWNLEDVEMPLVEDTVGEVNDLKDSPERVLHKIPFNRNRLGPSPIVAVRPLQKCVIEKQISEIVEPKKVIPAKVIKKCKFWPNCSIGETCLYHHPEAMCRLFPNCKFGDQCMFVHPVCKFGNGCKNISCPFFHILNSKLQQKGSGTTTSSNSQLCMFYPNCTSKPCKFVHPTKTCRFGALCSNFNCPFDHHSTLPTKDQLKWTKI